MSKNKLSQFQELVSELASQYVDVQKAVDRIYERRESTSNIETLESIRKLLTKVKQTEANIQPVRLALQKENIEIPPDTQSLIDKTIGIVTQLIPRLGTLEKAAIESREKLAPVIHEGVRSACMKTAYAKQQL